ncbi:MAG: hypothetical protein Q6351_008160 [Candidatus Njordarchaeum guaymaensis]
MEPEKQDNPENQINQNKNKENPEIPEKQKQKQNKNSKNQKQDNQKTLEKEEGICKNRHVVEAGLHIGLTKLDERGLEYGGTVK